MSLFSNSDEKRKTFLEKIDYYTRSVIDLSVSACRCALDLVFLIEEKRSSSGLK